MRRGTLISLGVAVSLLGVGSVQAAPRPVVLELFTSEGCSSCPPADALLTQLSRRPDVLPLAFHVTYWNSLGWHDPYSLDAATSRQSFYSVILGSERFTPQLIIDGRQGVIGSAQQDVAAAIDKARAEAAPVIPVEVKRDKEKLAISVGAAGASGKIVLIGFDPRHETAVGRGENAGHTLVETNVVRSIRTVGRFEGHPLRLSERPDAGESAAVIIQGDDGRVLGAARL